MITSDHPLPLGTWLRLQELQETIADETDLRVAIVAVLTGQTEQDVLNAPIDDFRRWNAAASFLETAPADRGRTASSYKVGGFTLKPTSDLRKVTTAQFIDFQSFAPQWKDRIPEMLSVFLVPDGCKYNDGYDVAEVQQALRDHLSVADALALVAFFLRKLAALLRATRRSSDRLLKKTKDPEKRERIRTAWAQLEEAAETLLGAGAGSPASTT